MKSHAPWAPRPRRGGVCSVLWVVFVVGCVFSCVFLVYGVSVRFETERQAANIHKQYVACAALFDVDAPKEDVVVVDSFVGPGYSLPTDQMKEAISLFAKKEGIFLDPVYTGKGAAGLIGLARNGTLKPGSKVLFLHTGGAPSLFHYQPLLDAK